MLTAAIIGAGRRGREVYGNIIKSYCNNLNINAVAEPNFFKRLLTAKKHKIPFKNQYKTYEKLLNKEKLSDALLITTMDHKHFYPTLLGLNKNYKILLEKPITPTFEQLKVLSSKVEEKRDNILITHTLRYTPFYKKVKELIDQGVIGKIINMEHKENVGYFHFTHSYVRGKWNTSEKAAPLFLAKSSHDFDLFTWLLNKKCCDVLARGDKSYFLKNNKPAKAKERCLKCRVESKCPYSAFHIYLGRGDYNKIPWPKEIIRDFPSAAVLKMGLKYTELGKCVYTCNSTMPEILNASLTYEDNIKVNFELNGLSSDMNRISLIEGTKGNLRANFKENKITLWLANKVKRVISPPLIDGLHGGGDIEMIKEFEKFIAGLNKNNNHLSTFDASLESHIAAFAAEKSRLTGKRISTDSYWSDLSLVL